MSDYSPVDRDRSGPRRRQLLSGIGGALLATGAISGTATGQETDVTVSLTNQLASAWVVTNVDGGEDVAPTGGGNPNPLLTLRVGTRYTFENDGWPAHPLAFRDENDDPLLTQGGTGQFENDASVNWTDNDQTVSFTVTESLGAALDDYICTVHSSMNGGVEVTEPQEPPAAVAFGEQTTDGTSVTVDSVRVDDGGFVTMHDSTLLDGDAIGSVVGVSAYLDPGSYEDVTVELDEALSEDQTLIAMPHRDSNGNETYDFVETGGGADGPYTDAEGAITAPAEVRVTPNGLPAGVTFTEQTTDGTSVTVDSVRVDDGGFVTMHDSTLLDGEAIGSVVGVSAYLDPGSYENVTVDLDEELSEDQTLIAMPHRDSNGNETYDFVESGGGADGPYTDADGALTDSAEVRVTPNGLPAGVTFTEQTTDGTSVTVDSLRVDDGGFVTMHDSTLLDGEAIGSVVGVSEYLDPGSYEDVTVELDEGLSEDQTLIAMPHRDSNGNETYDFVESGGGADGPYTDAEGAITASAEVRVTPNGLPAGVTFTEQTTDGTSVTVDSVRVDDGGFVTMHDSTLLDGEAIGSVVGVSAYLDPGSYEDVTVELDEELSEDQTLIAMPHRDSNGNETYDFVETEGGADGPYTDADGALTASAEVRVTPNGLPAGVTFTGQTTDGTSVTVDSVRMDDGGFVTMHDSTLLDGEAIGSVVGVSAYLDPGSYEDVTVELDEELSEDQTLIAMPHRDSNGNETYDFVETEGGADGPYTDADGALTASAEVTVETDTGDDGTGGGDDGTGGGDDGTGGGDDGTDGGDNATDGGDNATDGGDDSADGGGPGFGPLAGLAGLGGLASYAYRRLQRDTGAGTTEESDD